jgi:hypothetical protein
MWVTNFNSVSSSPTLLFSQFKGSLLHNLSHRLKSLNSPLTWGYLLFPQVTPLATTTTYNYIKAPMRFPFFDLLNTQLLQNKNLQSYTTERRLTK